MSNFVSSVRLFDDYISLKVLLNKKNNIKINKVPMKLLMLMLEEDYYWKSTMQQYRLLMQTLRKKKSTILYHKTKIQYNTSARSRWVRTLSSIALPPLFKSIFSFYEKQKYQVIIFHTVELRCHQVQYRHQSLQYCYYHINDYFNQIKTNKTKRILVRVSSNYERRCIDTCSLKTRLQIINNNNKWNFNNNKIPRHRWTT